jgi:hypothetical protein
MRGSSADLTTGAITFFDDQAIELTDRVRRDFLEGPFGTRAGRRPDSVYAVSSDSG